jgi:hypothetical protein
MAENRVLQRIFGRSDEAIRGFREMHNQELRNFYSSPDILELSSQSRRNG